MKKTANYDLVLNKGWKFHLGDVRRFNEQLHMDTYFATKAGGYLGNMDKFLGKNYWEDIEVPHDWQAKLPLDPGEATARGYKPREKGWYYVKFDLPQEEIEEARLVFDGVLGQTVVYVNGAIAVRNFSGYNRFDCDISCYLLPGQENLIALSVDATIWEGWWYEGAGLYRPVYIQFREKEHFYEDGCFIRTKEENGSWKMLADLEINGLDQLKEAMDVKVSLLDPQGNVVAETKEQADSKVPVELPVESPSLWSPENPVCYTCVCELISDKCVKDTVKYNVGFRKISWDSASGMYLNDKNYQVKGICCHQDHAGVGVATSAELIQYRIKKLRSFGINAYRCAHHAPTEEFLNICDRLGMMVMVENRHYLVSKEVMGQLETTVRMARNHPSVFIYSLFNEEPWQAEERGYRMARKMRELVLSLDDTRAVTAAMNGGVLTGSNASDAVDVVGINYYLNDYEECHRRTPDKAILGTENCPTFGTRGVYHSDEEKQVYNCYGDHWASFGESIEEAMECVERLPYNSGCFAWSGFDYYGEPEPYAWPSVTYQGGIMDICGFAKDTAYELAAWYKEELTVHLLPHWNWKEGEEVRICTFTNADTAELFVNGISAGEKKVARRRAEWKVPFEPGSILVKVRRGEEEACDEVRTAGKPAKLVMEDETPESSGNSVRILNLSVVDENGVLIPDFCKTVHFDVRKVKILGVGNGNPNGHQANIAPEVPMFHGRAQLIVTAGEGTIVAECDEVAPAKITLCDAE